MEGSSPKPSKCVTGPENVLFARASVHLPTRNFTGRGSEGVKVPAWLGRCSLESQWPTWATMTVSGIVAALCLPKRLWQCEIEGAAAREGEKGYAWVGGRFEHGGLLRPENGRAAAGKSKPQQNKEEENKRRILNPSVMKVW